MPIGVPIPQANNPYMQEEIKSTNVEQSEESN
jgi:hypothetical protein